MSAYTASKHHWIKGINIVSDTTSRGRDRSRSRDVRDRDNSMTSYHDDTNS